jgi:hypothetical protein
MACESVQKTLVFLILHCVNLRQYVKVNFLRPIMEVETMNKKADLLPRKNNEKKVDGKESYVLDTKPDKNTGLPVPTKQKVGK